MRFKLGSFSFIFESCEVTASLLASFFDVIELSRASCYSSYSDILCDVQSICSRFSLDFVKFSVFESTMASSDFVDDVQLVNFLIHVS